MFNHASSMEATRCYFSPLLGQSLRQLSSPPTTQSPLHARLSSQEGLLANHNSNNLYIQTTTGTRHAGFKRISTFAVSDPGFCTLIFGSTGTVIRCATGCGTGSSRMLDSVCWIVEEISASRKTPSTGV